MRGGRENVGADPLIFLIVTSGWNGVYGVVELSWLAIFYSSCTALGKLVLSIFHFVSLSLLLVK